MMGYIKGRLQMVRNMDLVNIILKMGIYMKDKCIKVWCKVEVNIHGSIRMYIKVLFFKIRWMEMENWYLLMVMSMRESLLIIEHVAMEKWLVIMVMLIRDNLWIIWNKGKENSLWRMGIFIKESSFKGNGTEEENCCFLMLLLIKVFG